MTAANPQTNWPLDRPVSAVFLLTRLYSDRRLEVCAEADRLPETLAQGHERRLA
jgi:hypothetical protein